MMTMKGSDRISAVPTPPRLGQEGSALIMVLILMAALSLMAVALLFHTGTETVIVLNEQDHMKALGFAEAGLAWAETRVRDRVGEGYTTLLGGPDSEDPADDFLLGLRDLSLDASDGFRKSNEGTASAIVQRDFLGTGPRAYEMIRLQDEGGTRAYVYVRLDGSYDDGDDVDDEDEDGDEDGGADEDGDDDEGADEEEDSLETDYARVRVTSVAEYPIFVDANGVALAPGGPRRPPARRIVEATIGGADPRLMGWQEIE
jgi:hypothetical protein